MSKKERREFRMRLIIVLNDALALRHYKSARVIAATLAKEFSED